MKTAKQLFRSFGFAWRGVVKVAKEEQNFRIQLVLAVLVAGAAYVFQLRSTEEAMLFLAASFVLVLELANSAVERIIDIMKPRIHHYAQDIKDIAAAAVLVASCGAVAVAAAIFWPHLAPLL